MDLKVEKSEDFALKVLDLYDFLTEKKEYVIANQIVRSGTSIGANIAESIFAESKEDYAHKLAIALKEASETRYWLRLLYKSQKIDKEYYDSLLKDCVVLIRILVSIKVKLKSSP